MIEVQIDYQALTDRLDKIKELAGNPDPIMRTVALAVLPELRHRVHVEGKDSSGGKIGTYSPEYMKVRTGNFLNGAKFKRGAKKGEFKEKKKAGEAGTFTKGEHKLGARPVYNRTNSTEVILSLTRQMENDLSVIDTSTGYGIGYLNPLNLQKALWCEATYKKKILTELTKEESDLVSKVAASFTDAYLKSDGNLTGDQFLGL